MTSMDDDQLYRRGVATMLASWETFARGSAGASLERLPGVSVAVFPNEPARSIYNNAVIDGDLTGAQRTVAIDAMCSTYRAAGIERYAAWINDHDDDTQAELIGRGFTFEESSRAMGMSLTDRADLAPGPSGVDVSAADLAEHLRLIEVSPDLHRGVDRDGLHVVVAALDGENVATALAMDHGGDCGVFNVSTFEPARRRGIGAALTHRLLRDAADRGCTTASLQSTPMAERVYASVGFRDLGQFLEFVPPT
jgi:GNAT superfamily N-acetyltransferase